MARVGNEKMRLSCESYERSGACAIQKNQKRNEMIFMNSPPTVLSGRNSMKLHSSLKVSNHSNSFPDSHKSADENDFYYNTRRS